MEGEIRITKLHNCQKEQGISFLVSKKLETDVKQRIGQDEFVFSLEGPEVRALHASPSASEFANCKYVLPYKLTVPGKYHMNFVHTRENYKGIMETERIFPEAHLDLPLGTGAFVQIGSG